MMPPSSFTAAAVPAIFLALSLLASRTFAANRDNDDRPNFIFVLTEDVGFGDLACYGHPYARTPNIDRMAAEGTKFIRHYVTGATCNPSRTGFMTSRHPASFPNYVDDFALQNTTTITDLLYADGYATGHMGKWHLGGENDPEQGTYGVQDIRIRGRSHNDPGGKDAVIFNSSLEFIKEHKDRPFYLNIWGHIAHSPVEPHSDLVRKFCNVRVDRNDFGFWTQDKFVDVDKLGGDVDDGMRHYLADLWGLDLQMGLLLDKLRDLDLEDKTVIVFTSDHGAAPVDPGQQRLPTRMMGVMGGLRGQKHSFYEGGVRVPYIVRYPGHVPAGKVNHKSIISGLDLLPTVATLAKVNYDPALYEGEDISDVWFGKDRVRANPLYWRFSRTDGDRAMLYGKWKLFISKNDERALYDLEADREERNNLYDTENATRLGMEENLQKWEDSLPKNYCRIDERYESCNNGRPLPYDPTIPPVKIGPPMNVTYDVVSYESVAVLAPSSIIFTASPTSPNDANEKSDSAKICSDYKPPTRVPTISPMPTADLPTVALIHISSDELDLSENEIVEENMEDEAAEMEEEEEDVDIVDEGSKTSPSTSAAASSLSTCKGTRCTGAYICNLSIVVVVLHGLLVSLTRCI